MTVELPGRRTPPGTRHDVGGRRWDEDEDGVRHRRERVHRLGARQDAAAEGIRCEDDRQESRFDRPLLISSMIVAVPFQEFREDRKSVV